MAGPACKIVIDETMRGLMRGLERALLSPLVRGPMITAEESDELIQAMADVELRAYRGPGAVADLQGDFGFVDILKRLEKSGVITAEVWELLHKPAD